MNSTKKIISLNGEVARMVSGALFYSAWRPFLTHQFFTGRVEVGMQT